MTTPTDRPTARIQAPPPDPADDRPRRGTGRRPAR